MLNPFWYSAPPPGGDPDFASVVLLLHCDGTDGSTTAIDSSNSAHTLTAVGDAQLDTAEKKFGTAAALFDGNDYFTIPDSSDWDFGTGDFTIELFVRYNGTEPASPRAVISSGAAGTVSSFWTLEGLAGNKLGFFVSAFSMLVPILETTTTSWSNTWRFIQINRSGTTWKLYVDGAEEDSATSSVSCNSNGGVVVGAGWYAPSSRAINASVDEVRITKVARANEVPTAAFPDS